MKKISITKINLVNSLSSRTGFSNLLSKKLINDIINILIKMTKKGDLNIKDLGKFKLISKKARMGRNPKTKENYLIGVRKSISFSASKKLLKDINI